MAKIPRSKVVSFRLTEEQWEKLKAEFKRVSCQGMKTEQSLARKFVVDAAYGRTVYKNPADRQVDTTLPSLPALPVARAKSKAKRKRAA